MIFKYLILVLICISTLVHSQNTPTTIKLENSIFEPLAKDVKTFEGVLGGCNAGEQSALFTLNFNNAVKEITLLKIRAQAKSFETTTIKIAIDNLGERGVVAASRPIETKNGLFLITAQSDGQLYISKIDLNKQTLYQSQAISKFRLNLQLYIDAVINKDGIWLFSGQDSDVQIDLVSNEFKLVESKTIAVSGQISKIEATSSAQGVFIATHAGEQYDLSKIAYANNKIITKSDGKRPYQRLAIDRNYDAGEFLGLHIFSMLGIPVGGLNIMHGQFGKSAMFGNSDTTLMKQQFSYPSIGFSRLDEKYVAIGVVANTKWMVHKAPLDINYKTAPAYSTYKFWIDSSVEAPRSTFDMQLFCPLTKDEFMGINIVEKKEQRGLFVGRFR